MSKDKNLLPAVADKVPQFTSAQFRAALESYANLDWGPGSHGAIVTAALSMAAEQMEMREKHPIDTRHMECVTTTTMTMDELKADLLRSAALNQTGTEGKRS